MSKYLKKIRDVIENISGLYIDRGGSKGSFILTHQKFNNCVWASQRSQLRTVLEQFNIDLVIDAGANEGQFAQMLRKFYPGEIHSFEPVISSYNILSESACSDPGWHTHPFALGSSESEKEIHVSGHSMLSSFLELNDFSFRRFGESAACAKTEQILVRRLDEVLRSITSGEKKRRIFLKMDTQGYDLEVFKGLGRRVNDVYALQSELSVIPIYAGMPHWTESILEFEKQGFNVAGMFPINQDAFKVIEYDCLFVRTAP